MSRLSLLSRLVIMGALIVAIAIAASLGVTLHHVRDEMYRQAQNSLRVNLAVAWDQLKAKGKDIRVADGQMKAGDYIVNGNYEIVDKVKELVGGNATLFMGDTRVTTNVTKADGTRAVGTKLAQGPVYDTVFKQGKAYWGEADILGVPHFTVYDPIKNAQGEVIGIVYAGLKKSDFLAIVDDLVRWNALVGLAIALVSGGLIFIAVRTMLRPLKQLQSAMETLSGGALDVAIPATERRDEIGLMARTVQVFKDNLAETERLREAQTEQKRQAETDRKAAMDRLAEEFERSVRSIVDGVASSSTELQATSQTMSQGAEEASRQATAVTALVEQSSGNVQVVASSAEELSASISEIGQQVGGSARIAGDAVTEVGRTSQAVEGLARSAEKIGEVVSLIQNIAAQTNLLALNATIEAARAGEAGKGFAVVASEVKQLASQTAKATEEITVQIVGIQSATSQTVTAIRSIGGTISRINEIAATIAAAVEQQGAATREIAGNVQQLALGTKDVTANVAGVEQAANDTGAAAAQVHGAATELSQRAEQLRSQVDTFVQAVRAA